MTATLIYAYNGIPTGGEEHPLPAHGNDIAQLRAEWGTTPGSLWERIAEGKKR